MDLYCAIDLRAGRVVRLRQGDYDDETVYGDDPLAVARRFADEGATWIHVVDLDAARDGSTANRRTVARVAAAVAGRAQVQTGGGVRSAADAAALADAGVARVVMGTAAVARPEVVAEAAVHLPVAVGLDHRAGEVAVAGWTEGSGRTLGELLAAFAACPPAAFVVTDIGRDGMLVGPDVDGLREAAAVAPAPVIASGGVATLDDLRALAAVGGLSGVICGKALYEGRFDVPAALAALAGAG